jgi:hypothetical protein
MEELNSPENRNEEAPQIETKKKTREIFISYKTEVDHLKAELQTPMPLQK